jgi:sugar phosphate permease
VRAQGLLWFAARWGGAITPFLVALLLQHISWRRAFELFGLLGVVWGAFFYFWYRDEPEDHPKVNAAELRLIREGRGNPRGHSGTPWGLIFGNSSVLLVMLQYFLLSYGWWFYIQWLPTYLKEARGFALPKDALFGAVLAGLPLFLGGIGCWVGGMLQPKLVARLGTITRARRAIGFCGLFAAGTLVLLSIQLRDPVMAMIVLGFAGFANDLTIPASWATCMDKGGPHTGTVAGAMNTMGAGGGMVAGPAVAYMLLWSNNNWELPLYVAAAGYFAAMVCWLFIDPVTPITQGQPAEAAA